MSRARIKGSAPPSFDPPDLTTLRVIVAVAESGSMSAGSDRAGLALGAVSGRITALERATGTALAESWTTRTHRAMLRHDLPARAPVRTLVRELRTA